MVCIVQINIHLHCRDRKEHLQLFLRHMHPVLQRQQLDYRIFVVEQAGDEAFNRAALMNVGYAEAGRKGAFDCFVFHDVDLVPEDDRSVYSCPKDTPKHLAVAVNKWKYRYWRVLNLYCYPVIGILESLPSMGVDLSLNSPINLNTGSSTATTSAG